MAPRIFIAQPTLRVRGVSPPGALRPGLRDAPVMVRTRLGGFNNVPGPNGSPGSPFWPYSESTMWGDGSQGGASPPQAPLPVGTPPTPLTEEQQQSQSTPFGQSARDWTNPCTYAGLPIVSGVGVVQGILTANYKRNSLIIQNNSTATSPDVAPTLYIGFNNEPGLNNGAMALPPGLGFYWGASDCPPRDNINVVFLGGNGGASVIIAGSVIQGTYIPA